MTALRTQGFNIATRIHGPVLVRKAANASYAREAVRSQRCGPNHGPCGASGARHRWPEHRHRLLREHDVARATANAGPAARPAGDSLVDLLLWPLAGRDGRDWVINNYVDLDPTSGTLDYTGGSGSGAKTYNGHTGIDIDVPNFRWMDGGVSIVLAAESGVVTSVHDNEPDRNTSCTVMRTSCRSVMPTVLPPSTAISGRDR